MERSIQEACCDYLALDNWRRVRTDMPQLRGLGVQEKGMCDDLFIRYRTLVGFADVLWIEWKSKKGIHGQKQVEWQAAERARGALVWVAKKDFEPTVEGFMDHYRESGLMRKNIR